MKIIIINIKIPLKKSIIPKVINIVVIVIKVNESLAEFLNTNIKFKELTIKLVDQDIDQAIENFMKVTFLI